MASELDRFSLAGRVALVPGGSGGIGRRICVAFARLGARVALVSRSADHGREARELIRQESNGEPDVLVLTGDVTRPEDAQAAVEHAVKEFGSLDILVNAVGGGGGVHLLSAPVCPPLGVGRPLRLTRTLALFHLHDAA